MKIKVLSLSIYVYEVRDPDNCKNQTSFPGSPRKIGCRARLVSSQIQLCPFIAPMLNINAYLRHPVCYIWNFCESVPLITFQLSCYFLTNSVARVKCVRLKRSLGKLLPRFLLTLKRSYNPYPFSLFT